MRQQRHLLLGLGAIALLNACGKTAPVTPSTPSYVIGVDNRVSVNNAQYPWSAVGRLKLKSPSGGDGYCTATLVGPDVALTAAHCLYNNGIAVASAEFLLQYSYGQSVAKATVVKKVVGTTQPHWSEASDWALVKLDKDLGHTYGWLGIYGLAPKDIPYPMTVSLAGYSSDAAEGDVLSAHLNCNLLKRFVSGEINASMVDTISHNCDLETGASGGPLIAYYQGTAYVVGVQSYHATHSTGLINGAAPTDKAKAAYGSL